VFLTARRAGCLRIFLYLLCSCDVEHIVADFRLKIEAMKYLTFRQLDSGESLHIATHTTRQEAERLIESLNTHWPGIYVIQKIKDEPPMTV